MYLDQITEPFNAKLQYYFASFTICIVIVPASGYSFSGVVVLSMRWPFKVLIGFAEGCGLEWHGMVALVPSIFWIYTSFLSP